MSKDDSDDVSSANEVRESETFLTPEMESQDWTGDEFSPFDEVAEEFKPSVIRKTIAADGLPTNSFSGGSSDIPPLSPETLVCMEDTSQFVIRDEYGQISKLVSPDDVVRLPNGGYYLKLSQREQDSYDSGRDVARTEVFPIRPRCEHYVRQMAMFDYNPEGKVHLRLCSARRTTEGTFMTVRDSAMWACSMRVPRDLKTEEEFLEKFDNEKVEQGKRRQHFSIFKKEE